MTQEQTRQLGIEFERRLYEIYPEFQINWKLDTDVIYSMLNDFQDKYVKGLYLAIGQLQSDSREYKKVQDSIKTLIRHKKLSNSNIINNIESEDCATMLTLPADYYLYVRSTSIVNKTYKSDTVQSTDQFLPNVVIKQEEANNIIISVYNNNGILRKPLVVLESISKDAPYIKIIHDKYTQITGLDLVYYCKPYDFNVLNYDDSNTDIGAIHSTCELPYICFKELVDGAVDLYIQQYKFKLQSGSSSNKRSKKQDDE